MNAESKKFQRLRNRKLASSVYTAILARFSGIALQVFSIPFAAISLGNDGFALYAMLIGILSWLSLSKIGVGPALTVALSSQNAKGIDQDNHVIISNGFIVVVILTTLTVFLSIIAFNSFGVFNSLFKNYESYYTEIYKSLAVILTAFVLYSIFSVYESIQLAYQEQYYFNVLLTVGTAVSAVLVFAVANSGGGVFSILLAANAPQLIARTLNVIVFCMRNSLVLPRLTMFDFKLSLSLLKDGSRYFLSGPANNFAFNVLPIIYVGATSSFGVAAAFAAVMNAVVLMSSFYGVINGPLLAAVAEAQGRGDKNWVSSSYLKVLSVSLVLGSVVMAVFAIIGEQIFSLWYSGTIDVAASVLVIAAIYFTINGVEVVNYTVLSGVGKIKLVSVVMLIKCIIFVYALFILPSDNLYMLFMLMSIVAFIFSTIPLSIIAKRGVV